MEAHNCTLQVSAKEKKGILWLKKGEPIAARTDFLRGESAALEIISWKNVVVDIDYSIGNIQREISTSLMSLILDGSRIDDENDSQRPNRRTRKRSQLLMTVEYEMGNMIRQCALYDISRDGAYIETDQSMEIGQAITLSFFSPVMKRKHFLNATVIRKNERGLGIQFQKMNVDQEKIFQPLIDEYISLAQA